MPRLLLALYLTFSISAFADDTLRLIFAGDVMQHITQIKAAETDVGVYRYDSCFSFLKEEIKNADFSVANLELTCAGAPYSGYPMFSAPDAIVEALKNAGFNLLSTANNHCCDKGAKGIERTIDVLDKYNLYHVGTYKNCIEKSYRYPQIVEHNGFKLAFLAYTYGTNGMAVPALNLVNLIDTVQMAVDIELAKQQNPDIIIALMHWGEEYKLKPSAAQQRIGEFLLARGVRLIIGSHPHVIQQMETQIDSTGHITSSVVYSLGNAVSNQSFPNTNIGALAHISLVKKENETTIADTKYSLTVCHRPREKGRTRYYIIPSNTLLNKKQLFGSSDYILLDSIVDKTRKRLNGGNMNFGEKR
jgi:poly-gamma-glutamate synthesis protein (capsule biosynthesis protein)